VTDITEQNEDLKSGMGVVQSGISTLKIGVDTLQLDRNASQHRSMLEWLSKTDFPSQQVDFISRREPGTGQWFLDSPELHAWLKEPKSTLFCRGIPGSGKTIMAAVAIDHLCGTVQSNAVGVAYLYCNYKTQTDQTATTLLSALLKQLTQNRPHVAGPVSALYDKNINGNTRPSTDEILKIPRRAILFLKCICRRGRAGRVFQP
jgi:hypothetical protein